MSLLAILEAFALFTLLICAGCGSFLEISWKAIEMN